MGGRQSSWEVFLGITGGLGGFAGTGRLWVATPA